MKTGIYWQDPKYALRPGQDFIFDPSLVLYLPLHKLDGASIMSRDAYGHLCTVTGALWRPNGRLFDGDDDDISIPHHASFNITAAITLEAWIKMPNTGDDVQDFVAKTWEATEIPYCFRYEITAATLIFFTYSAGGDTVTGTAGLLAYDEWQHIVVTFDAGTTYFYINGVQDGPFTHTGNALYTNTGVVYVGTYNRSNYFKGNMGEVRIYNRGLTSLEVQRNYLASKGRYQ